MAHREAATADRRSQSPRLSTEVEAGVGQRSAIPTAESTPIGSPADDGVAHRDASATPARRSTGGGRGDDDDAAPGDHSGVRDAPSPTRSTVWPTAPARSTPRLPGAVRRSQAGRRAHHGRPRLERPDPCRDRRPRRHASAGGCEGDDQRRGAPPDRLPEPRRCRHPGTVPRASTTVAASVEGLWTASRRRIGCARCGCNATVVGVNGRYAPRWRSLPVSDLARRFHYTCRQRPVRAGRLRTPTRRSRAAGVRRVSRPGLRSRLERCTRGRQGLDATARRQPQTRRLGAARRRRSRRASKEERTWPS